MAVHVHCRHMIRQEQKMTRPPLNDKSREFRDIYIEVHRILTD